MGVLFNIFNPNAQIYPYCEHCEPPKFILCLSFFGGKITFRKLASWFGEWCSKPTVLSRKQNLYKSYSFVLIHTHPYTPPESTKLWQFNIAIEHGHL